MEYNDIKNFKDLHNISREISNIKKNKIKNIKTNILFISLIILEITGYAILIIYNDYKAVGGFFFLFWSKYISRYLDKTKENINKNK